MEFILLMTCDWCNIQNLHDGFFLLYITYLNWFLTRCCETLSIEHFPFFQNLFIFSFCLDVLFVVTLDLPKKKQTRTVGTCRVYKYIRNMVYIYEKLFTFFILLYWQLILILLRKIKGGALFFLLCWKSHASLKQFDGITFITNRLYIVNGVCYFHCNFMTNCNQRSLNTCLYTNTSHKWRLHLFKIQYLTHICVCLSIELNVIYM